MNNSLPRLYKNSPKGIHIIDITFSEGEYTVSWGLLDGKHASVTSPVTPKNIGRINETTPLQQARAEATAKFIKKKKLGYSESLDAPNEVQLPMKVRTLQSSESKITYPCSSTPKYNGVNALYVRSGDTLQLYSRGGKPYKDIPHLVSPVLEAMNRLNVNVLNGELYIPNQHLQDITSAVKKPNLLSKQLSFYVFDVPSSLPYSERRKQLKQLKGIPHIIPVIGIICNSRYGIEEHYSKCIQLGLEGTVIKLLDGPYEFNTRSNYQFKYKKALDAEFRVTSYYLDKAGHPVYYCETNGQSFKVKRKGTFKERSLDAAQAESNIGKWLTVEYETLSKTGIPLKPVGLNFRECDNQGNPLS